jgi:predicted nucleic acid-binding protein
MIAVVDASVALKWQFEDEETTERAMAMLSDYVENAITLIAPGLFPYEILSGINVAVNRKRIGQEAGKEAVNYILSLGVQLRTSHDLFVSAFQLAREHGLSTYDCAYISLAQKESCDFVTGDKKLYRSCSGKLPMVKWLGDYPFTAAPARNSTD